MDMNVKFFRFFSLSAKSFVNFIFLIDLSLTLALVYPLYILPEFYEDSSLFIPLLFHFNYFYCIITIVSFIYYITKSEMNWFIHRFYLWSRFLYYFGFAVSCIVLSSGSMFYELNKKDKKHIHLTIITLTVIFCFFFVMNIMWSLAMKTILENMEEE